MSIRSWCAAQGINEKTYYGRRQRVREAMLEGIVMEDMDRTVMKTAGPIAGPRALCAAKAVETENLPSELVKPVFAAVSMPQVKGIAMTVHMGSCTVEIQNGADGALVEHVLRAVAGV
jgi:hypothetical protein